ncbi:MAG: hypothetical protein CMJ95_14045, partial [Planctomycetes bacterium]|nr:hypothetical protein [Planctomycetota bacterium]
MPFDKKKVVEEVNRVLEGIPLPGTPTNIVKAGIVQRVIAHQGEITLVVQFASGLTTDEDSLVGRRRRISSDESFSLQSRRRNFVDKRVFMA